MAEPRWTAGGPMNPHHPLRVIIGRGQRRGMGRNTDNQFLRAPDLYGRSHLCLIGTMTVVAARAQRNQGSCGGKHGTGGADRRGLTVK